MNAKYHRVYTEYKYSLYDSIHRLPSPKNTTRNDWLAKNSIHRYFPSTRMLRTREGIYQSRRMNLDGTATLLKGSRFFFENRIGCRQLDRKERTHSRDACRYRLSCTNLRMELNCTISGRGMYSRLERIERNVKYLTRSVSKQKNSKDWK